MQRLLTGAFVALCACSGQGERSTIDTGTARGASAPSSAERTIVAGTALTATIQRLVSSRVDTTGAPVNAILSLNVLDAHGAVAIPGGSEIVLTIAELHGARDAAGTGGTITLAAGSVIIGGTSYRLSGKVGTVAHTLNAGKTSSSFDVVVTPGTPITITLIQPLTIVATQSASTTLRPTIRSQETR
jgi:hypothetical protein